MLMFIFTSTWPSISHGTQVLLILPVGFCDWQCANLGFVYNKYLCVRISIEPNATPLLSNNLHHNTVISKRVSKISYEVVTWFQRCSRQVLERVTEQTMIRWSKYYQVSSEVLVISDCGCDCGDHHTYKFGEYCTLHVGEIDDNSLWVWRSVYIEFAKEKSHLRVYIRSRK